MVTFCMDLFIITLLLLLLLLAVGCTCYNSFHFGHFTSSLVHLMFVLFTFVIMFCSFAHVEGMKEFDRTEDAKTFFQMILGPTQIVSSSLLTNKMHVRELNFI